MSREQILKTAPQVNIPNHLTPVQVSPTSLLYKSILFIADINNTDFIYIGDIVQQNIPLAPGKSLEITGDNYDVGASARYDISKLYVRANMDNSKFTIVVGDGI